MIADIRKAYNQSFTKEKYSAFLKELDALQPGALDFRMAETPVFIDEEMREKLLSTCNYIIQQIKSPSFKEHTKYAVPSDESFPNQNNIPNCLVIDFGICKNEKNELYPALIELQGFPSLYAFQAIYPSILENHFTIPEGYTHFFNGYSRDTYIQLLKEVIVGDHNATEVVLLEIKPNQQKTRIDFYLTEQLLGVQTICITELRSEGKKLYYLHNGRKQFVKRIYNRIILDELKKEKESLGTIIDLQANWEVSWIPHPNWFYLVSKYLLPNLHHPYIPETFFLDAVNPLPENLENYVVKPLFSFAGQGVIIDVKKSDIDQIHDKSNWILQKKVEYAPCIKTPDGNAKAEIRMMYLWRDEDEQPILVTNLVRLSKGEMIGTRYNKDKEWVGGTVAYFKQ
jgi:hypothetical protein